MLIILEGPDGGGKTTLAERLRDRPNRPNVIHHGPYLGEPSIFDRYANPMAAMYASRGHDVVFDRSWISEPIYGTAMRDGEDRIGTKARMLERAAMGLGAVVVLCLPPWKAVKENFARRSLSEYARQEATVEQIWQAYRRISTAIPLLTYDYTKDSAPVLLANIEALRVKYGNPGPGVGLWYPERVTLMVGERQGLPLSRPPSWAFIGENGCAPWMADRLDEIGVCENELYWVNAIKNDGQPLDFGFVRVLRPLRIIALGKVADGVLTDRKIEHIAIEHPQAWKRFHYQERWINLRNAFHLKGSHDLTIF